MTESIKATRAQVTIGSLTVDGFMLPDGGLNGVAAGNAGHEAGVS